jgi:hypothetical protein
VNENDHISRYESYDQKIRPIVTFTIALAAITVLVLWLMKVTSIAFTRDALEGSRPIHPLADATKPEIPPEPRLQDAPAVDLELFRERERKKLSTYEWIDRANGVVRIPVERAMELVAREGLPARAEKPKGDAR